MENTDHNPFPLELRTKRFTEEKMDLLCVVNRVIFRLYQW